MVTREDIKKAAHELGIRSGDTVLVHSSFKSFGGVEGGAAAVIGGFMDAIGEEGTLVFPTLCKEDWEHVYENWNMDAPSDVGYLTNYFRSRLNIFYYFIHAFIRHRRFVKSSNPDTSRIYARHFRKIFFHRKTFFCATTRH